MSRKAPKNYNKNQQPKTTATAAEERQARKVIYGIAIALIAIVVITVVAYHFILQ